MIRTHWMTSSAAAKAYYRQSDYYATTPGEWLGSGAKMLGLEGATSPEQFDSLADNLDPRTGLPLTTYTRDGRRVGLDMTFNSTKSVGIARELGGPDNAGDPRIEQAHREAVAYAMRFVERDMQARVRAAGQDSDRITGNMVAYRVTHRDTRISAEDGMPDMSLHDHVFIFNATYDPVERKWKAAQIGQIKHDAPYYEAIYHNRLASNLRELGYGIRRKDKAFEIAGVSDDLVKKFSRRRQYIKAVADKLGITSAAGMDKLGATTRLGKAKELADDLNTYYVSRLTQWERHQLADLQGKPSYLSSDEKAVRFAIDHEFYNKSVVEERRLYETALRHGIGSVTPEEVEAECQRQGVLLKNGKATTKEVLAEESRIIAFAREGRGTMRPLAKASEVPKEPATLSPEQQAMVSHVLNSTDRVSLVIGDAGTGKTRSIKAAFQEINRPIEIIAPSSDASRNVLRGEGFSKADTVASFLGSAERQAAVRNGVIWVDEAGMLPIRDLGQLVEVARQQHARLVLQGDPKQHKSPARHGNMMNVLQEYAGLPVGRLTEIWRQTHKVYKQAVASIAKGDILTGYDKLKDLGWIKQVPVFDHNKPLVDDYVAGLNAGKSMLVVAPTHKEGNEITAEIRTRLQQEGKLGDEHTVATLRPLAWTEAQKADPSQYDGTEVVQFFRNSGPFRAGQRVQAGDLLPQLERCRAGHFAVYRPGVIALAEGDRVRITANGKTADGFHRVDNGAGYTVDKVADDGQVTLNNGWVLPADFGHLTHGYVTTSHASQGKTVDRVLIAMGHESRPAINGEQFYVSVSRGRERATIYSDLSPSALREAIQRQDTRKSATELMRPRRQQKDSFLKKMQKAYRRLRERAAEAILQTAHEREAYAR